MPCGTENKNRFISWDKILQYYKLYGTLEEQMF